jgi:hypothetical protein
MMPGGNAAIQVTRTVIIEDTTNPVPGQEPGQDLGQEPEPDP